MRPKIALLLTAFLILSLIANVSAITGSIGNSRMVLRLETGEEIEKYILVKNKNDETLIIDLSPVGDLAENVEIKEDTFELQPNEEKKAYFTIYADEEGSTETKIDVRFTPEEGNGVGLTSTIIVLASGESGNVPEENTDDTEIPGVTFNPSPSTGTEDSDKKFEITPTMILIISTLVLIAIFFALVMFAKKANGKKGSRRPHA
ncbi:MAG: hypothetical protein ACTSWQ_08505 [Candidatus Thorarchaeota archaeon]